MISQQNSPQPWYIKKKNSQQESPFFAKNSYTAPKQNNLQKPSRLKSIFSQFFPSFLSFVFLTLGVVAFILSFFELTKSTFHVVYLIAAILFLFSSLACLFYQIGSICHFFSTHPPTEAKIPTALQYLQGLIEKEEPRHGMPAPEMALYQFVQQVRAYATEKSFLKQKQEKLTNTSPTLAHTDPNVIIKRRWNDVMDSLNEFEIYLANDPQGMIDKLIAKSPLQNIDVSQIFRDVAETFDTTWRRKGINIEQAIVTPLKANTNEALLRRLLVGPWRTCVYLAKRGNEVIFTAKSQNGKIVAHWECEGVVYPEEFYEVLRDGSLTVNDRIEKGMAIVGSDPHSPNMLFALISFVTWLDLALASSTDFTLKQGSEGLIIEMNI